MSEGSHETNEPKDVAPAEAGRSVLSYGVDEAEPGAPVATLALVASLLFLPLVALAIGVRTQGMFLVALAMPIVAIILARVVQRRPTADPSARRLARAAIWTACVQLGLVAIAMCLMPSTSRAPEPANRIKCASNLKQFGLALQLYSNANHGMYPPSFDEILNDLGAEVFLCPSWTDERAQGPTTRALIQDFHSPGHCSYVYAIPPGTPASAITAKHILAYEALTNHSGKGINVVYGDGTVDWLDTKDAQHVIAELRAGFNPPRP